MMRHVEIRNMDRFDPRMVSDLLEVVHLLLPQEINCLYSPNGLAIDVKGHIVCVHEAIKDPHDDWKAWRRMACAIRTSVTPESIQDIRTWTPDLPYKRSTQNSLWSHTRYIMRMYANPSRSQQLGMTKVISRYPHVWKWLSVPLINNYSPPKPLTVLWEPKPILDSINNEAPKPIVVNEAPKPIVVNEAPKPRRRDTRISFNEKYSSNEWPTFLRCGKIKKEIGWTVYDPWVVAMPWSFHPKDKSRPILYATSEVKLREKIKEEYCRSSDSTEEHRSFLLEQLYKSGIITFS